VFRRTLLIVVLSSGIGIGLGCSESTPSPSDPALGKQTLQNALEAWKKGESVDSYKQSTPNVTVADRQWKDGAKLLDYEFDGDSVPDGFDVQFKVKLTVQDASGKPSKKKAVYNVSTTPAFVIVRAAEPGS